MTVHPAILQIVQSVLGNNARFNAMNIIRNSQGQAISNWHVDDVLEFPLPPEIPRFDARIRMPVLWLRAGCAERWTLENGPTVVPGGHYWAQTGGSQNLREGCAFDLCAGDHQPPIWAPWRPIFGTTLSDATAIRSNWADRRFRGVA
jgi:hypothetical protein